MCIAKVTITNDTHVAAPVLSLIWDIFNVGRSYVKPLTWFDVCCWWNTTPSVVTFVAFVEPIPPIFKRKEYYYSLLKVIHQFSVILLKSFHHFIECLDTFSGSNITSKHYRHHINIKFSCFSQYWVVAADCRSYDKMIGCISSHPEQLHLYRLSRTPGRHLLSWQYAYSYVCDSHLVLVANLSLQVPNHINLVVITISLERKFQGVCEKYINPYAMPLKTRANFAVPSQNKNMKEIVH